MSIEQLEERMISKQSIDENLEKQKHILKKSEVLESIYNTLNDIDKETTITFNEEYWPHLEYLSEEQVS